MASSGQEQSQHEMMDQMIQMSKELNHEKTAHTEVKHQLLCCIEDMKKIETASLGTIKVFLQLVSHNQNVERAMALNQQCLDEQKDAQATEMQDLKQRAVELATNRDQLENFTLTIQNRMLMAQCNQLRNEKSKKMTKTQTNEGEVQIKKLETYVRNVQTQLNHEKRELTAKLLTNKTFLEDSCCSIDLEMKIAEVRTTKLATINAKEKQQIMAQIHSSQTELKKAMNVSHQQNERNEELQQELKLESEQQSSNDIQGGA